MGLTKFVLKRPVTTVMALLCLLVFGISSVFSATLEQMPDMETPMMIVSARYEDVYKRQELVAAYRRGDIKEKIK